MANRHQDNFFPLPSSLTLVSVCVCGRHHSQQQQQTVNFSACVAVVVGTDSFHEQGRDSCIRKMNGFSFTNDTPPRLVECHVNVIFHVQER